MEPEVGSATIVVKRRTWVQDAVRVHKVIVDDQIIGAVGPLRTKSFPVNAGRHRIRLAMPDRGRSSSDPIDVDLKVGQTCAIRTVRRGDLRRWGWRFQMERKHLRRTGPLRVATTTLPGFTFELKSTPERVSLPANGGTRTPKL